MRIRGFLISILMASCLSACTSTPDGRPTLDIDNWFRGEPSAMEKNVGRLPTGYAGQNRHNVLKPPRRVVTEVTTTQAPSWSEIQNYDEQGMPYDFAPIDGSAHVAVVPPPPQGIPYNKDVSVFPVDGMPAGQGYSYTSAPYPVAGDPARYDFYGQLVQQLYFAHGSSSLGNADRQKLRQLGDGVKRMANDVSLTVVGHASKRVDGVSDPIRKKMINFEMAQKRAEAVTRELKKSGVNPAWVRTVSKGDDEPNAFAGGKPQEEADRRAEVYMDSK